MRWLRVQRRLPALLCAVVVAMSCTTTAPTATLQPRPVATARETANYAAPTTLSVNPTRVSVVATPTVSAAKAATVASIFEHPWPVGTKVTAYTTNDELAVIMVDEVIAVLPEFEAYVVLGQYVPDVWLVPWALMQTTVTEIRGGQYAFARVEWYVPGQTPVVLWEVR